MITPAVMILMMPMRGSVGRSRRKMKAQMRTNPRTEDLHIAMMRG